MVAHLIIPIQQLRGFPRHPSRGHDQLDRLQCVPLKILISVAVIGLTNMLDSPCSISPSTVRRIASKRCPAHLQFFALRVRDRCPGATSKERIFSDCLGDLGRRSCFRAMLPRCQKPICIELDHLMILNVHIVRPVPEAMSKMSE